MSRRNVFAGPYLDRESYLRGDPDWYASALLNKDSRAVAVWNSRNLVIGESEPRAAFLSLNEIPVDQRDGNELILLGRFHGAPIFACEIDSLDPPMMAEGTRFEDLRTVASVLPPDDAGLLAYARALSSWRRRNRFCGSCGSATLSAKGGHVRACANPACRHDQFPRLDPAIIVLITDGTRALLGRQASWPLGRYSTIAGFVEPGESLEDAVAREVWEETGVNVDTIRYHSSQPWPFPSSLMLGFTAHAVTHTVQLHDNELEDARWFTRAEIAAGSPLLPPGQSISFRLIEHWFDSAGDTPLRDLRSGSAWPASR